MSRLNLDEILDDTPVPFAPDGSAPTELDVIERPSKRARRSLDADEDELDLGAPSSRNGRASAIPGLESVDEPPSDESVDEDVAREHYAATGRSQLRNAAAQFELDDRYAGRRVTRAELDGDDEDEVADSVESDEDEGDETLNFAAGGSIASSNEDDEDDEPAPAPRRSAARSPSPVGADDDQAMLAQLRQAASADIEKGQDVKKQLALWDELLEDRIRMQRVLKQAEALASEDVAALDDEEKSACSKELGRLSDALFDLRKELMRVNASLSPPARKQSRTDDDLDSTIASLKALSETYEPHLRSTITKWSDKVSAASGSTAALRAANRFSQRALDRNVWDQITSTLANDAERLIARTRRDGDVNSFDDTDFYQQLLRDVVEHGGRGADDPALAGLRGANGTRKKVKKVVDTRASKGRKLRYDVHDKLVQFMVSRPHPGFEGEAWGEDQARELFAGLLGSTNVPGIDDTPAPAAVPAAANGDAGSRLRIFG